MEFKDMVPVGALILSVVSLGWQGITAFRGRRRLVVTASIVTRWTAPILDLPAKQEFVVLVTTRSLGGKNGIENFDFEWDPQPETWGMSPADMPLLTPGTLPDPLAIADAFNANKVLEDGEVSHKMFTLRAGNRMDGVDRPYDVTAVVRQSNGKVWKSNAVRIFPPEWFDQQDVDTDTK